MTRRTEIVNRMGGNRMNGLADNIRLTTTEEIGV
jgi:hypothetical protein